MLLLLLLLQLCYVKNASNISWAFMPGFTQLQFSLGLKNDAKNWGIMSIQYSIEMSGYEPSFSKLWNNKNTTWVTTICSSKSCLPKLFNMFRIFRAQWCVQLFFCKCGLSNFENHWSGGVAMFCISIVFIYSALHCQDPKICNECKHVRCCLSRIIWVSPYRSDHICNQLQFFIRIFTVFPSQWILE